MNPKRIPKPKLYATWIKILIRPSTVEMFTMFNKWNKANIAAPYMILLMEPTLTKALWINILNKNSSTIAPKK